MLKDERSRGGAGRSEKEAVCEDENKEGEDQGEEKKLEDDQEEREYKYEVVHFLIVMREKLVIKMCKQQTLLPTTWHYLLGVVVCR